MSKDLPASIEPLRLAREGTILTGSFPLEKMERIQSSLCDNHGEVYIHWSFYQNEQRRSIIQGKIETQLSLQCQRCLQPMNYQLNTSVALIVSMQTQNDDEANDLPADYELLELTQKTVSLLTLVEDELILALPVVVMHEHCPINQFVDTTPSDELIHNPFYILTKLKQ